MACLAQDCYHGSEVPQLTEPSKNHLPGWFFRLQGKRLRIAQKDLKKFFTLMNCLPLFLDFTFLGFFLKIFFLHFVTGCHMHSKRGCKPEPPKFPSRQFHPCHKGIQVNHLAVTLKGIVSVQQNVSPSCRRYLGKHRERLGVTCCFALR